MTTLLGKFLIPNMVDCVVFERSHFTQFGKEASDFVNVIGGVPQPTG